MSRKRVDQAVNALDDGWTVMHLDSLCTMLSAGIKLATFDTAKGMLGHANKAYDEELVKWQRGTRVKQSSSGLI